MVDKIEDISLENSNSISLARHKIVFIGDVSVGKTSILTRFLDNKYKDKYEGKNFKLQIWDSAGQERYKSLIPTYIRERETFESVSNWISFVKNIETPLIILLGNKIDLQRKVDTSEAQRLASREGILFFEVSAKTNSNIKNAFFTSLAELPIFEKLFTGDKEKLIKELENENDESKIDSTITESGNNIGLNIINKKPSLDNKKINSKCIC